MANDDTELLALGTRLDKIADEWLAQMAADRSDDAAHDAKVEALTGVPASNAPPFDADHPYWSIRGATPFDQPAQQIDNTWNDIHARLFPLCERILAMRAHTLAGLRVQATAISLAAANLWDNGPHDNDDSPHHERMFIECVHAFLGITPIPKNTFQNRREKLR
jgi:hypothetical protein